MDVTFDSASSPPPPPPPSSVPTQPPTPAHDRSKNSDGSSSSSTNEMVTMGPASTPTTPTLRSKSLLTRHQRTSVLGKRKQQPSASKDAMMGDPFPMSNGSSAAATTMTTTTTIGGKPRRCLDDLFRIYLGIDREQLTSSYGKRAKIVPRPRKSPSRRPVAPRASSSSSSSSGVDTQPNRSPTHAPGSVVHHPLAKRIGVPAAGAGAGSSHGPKRLTHVGSTDEYLGIHQPDRTPPPDRLQVGVRWVPRASNTVATTTITNGQSDRAHAYGMPYGYQAAAAAGHSRNGVGHGHDPLVSLASAAAARKPSAGAIRGTPRGMVPRYGDFTGRTMLYSDDGLEYIPALESPFRPVVGGSPSSSSPNVVPPPPPPRTNDEWSTDALQLIGVPPQAFRSNGNMPPPPPPPPPRSGRTTTTASSSSPSSPLSSSSSSEEEEKEEDDKMLIKSWHVNVRGNIYLYVRIPVSTRKQVKIPQPGEILSVRSVSDASMIISGRVVSVLKGVKATGVIELEHVFQWVDELMSEYIDGYDLAGARPAAGTAPPAGPLPTVGSPPLSSTAAEASQSKTFRLPLVAAAAAAAEEDERRRRMMRRAKASMMHYRAKVSEEPRAIFGPSFRRNQGILGQH